ARLGAPAAGLEPAAGVPGAGLGPVVGAPAAAYGPALAAAHVPAAEYAPLASVPVVAALAGFAPGAAAPHAFALAFVRSAVQWLAVPASRRVLVAASSLATAAAVLLALACGVPGTAFGRRCHAAGTYSCAPGSTLAAVRS